MANLLQKRRARRRLRDGLGFWFHPQYEPKSLAQTSRVPGIEVARGEKILGSLVARGLLRPREIRPAPIASHAQLATVHPETYLEKTARADALGRIFGLEGKDVDVDPMLMAQRRQVGGTIEASRWAVRGEDRLAFNFGGGFHHAEPEEGAGFCVYNDVAIAIAEIRSNGYEGAISIVDLDYHQGNGNIVTFAEDSTVRTYSIHGAIWSHIEAEVDDQLLLPSGTTDEEYLDTLERTLPPSFDAQEPELVYYIAGTDILGVDRLGEFAMTRKGALDRDRFVIDLARSRGCNIVVTMAGGYSEDAWRSTRDFAQWILTDEAHVSEEPEPSLFQQYSEIAQELDPRELQRSTDDWKITEADLFGDLSGPEYKSTRLLDYYSKHGIEFAMERYGLLDAIRERGFVDLRPEIEPADPQRQKGKLYGSKDGTEYLLVDLIVGRVRKDAPEDTDPDDRLELLSIEWLMLQNPTQEFSLRHPQWPGQEHPGLGVAEQTIMMLFQAAHRLKLDGVVQHPSRYHIAFICSSQFVFLDPKIQGRFEALREALSHLDLNDATWLMERGEVRWADDGSPVEWIPEDIVIPTSDRLVVYFGSTEYLDLRNEAKEQAEARGFLVGDEP